MSLKRIAAATLASMMLFSVTACSKNKGATTDNGYEDKSSVDFSSTPTADPTSGDVFWDFDLSEEDMKLYKGSYDILYNRITDRGYAITSLTGTYFGMFTRDSAIQTMAHLAYGDSDAARAILRYLLSYHTALDLKRGTHIIDEIKEEEYRNTYLNGKDSTAFNYYEEQTEPGAGHYLLNAPNNASATPFVTKKHSIDSVSAYLEGAAGATVKAEIYKNLMDASTIVGKGSYTFSTAGKGFVTIPLDASTALVPGDTYYLKLYATEGSGNVVWYGVTSAKAGYLKSWNYDKKAYGGNGWQELEVYTSFVIGESDTQITEDYQIVQRKSDMAIYMINAPENGGAQPFVPKNELIYGVEVHLDKSTNSDKVNVMICEDYQDFETAIAQTTYTFGEHASGWQSISFDAPVSVTPGKTYYLVVQATADSGRVVWNGTSVKCDCPKSFNYDKNVFGGWTGSNNYLAFEIISFPTEIVSKGFEARGKAASSVELELFAPKAGGTVKVEIRKDYADPKTTIGTAQAQVDKIGIGNYTLVFDEEVPVEFKDHYYIVVTLTDTAKGTRVMTDPTAAASSYAYGDGWKRVGYDFHVNAGFEVDKSPVITLDGKTAGVQEIPTDGELITTVKVLLSKDEGAKGKVKATLYKDYGANAQLIDSKTVDIEKLSVEAGWVSFAFDLPLVKTQKNGNYYVKLETVDAKGNVYWCGSTTIDNYETFIEKDGVKTVVAGEAGFEALQGIIRLLSDYTQTDATYMLIHAWVMYVNNNQGKPEDLEFIEQSYPIIKRFANYFLDNKFFNKKMNLILNPSLEHSKKGRYWIAYDLITNVFASQAFYELSFVAESMNDAEMKEHWMNYSKKIEGGIHKNLVTEVDGKKIYAEFYDAENNKMDFYNGISWVNFAPVAAEWYGMDLEIMKNTYEIYKKHAGIKMLGFDGLATDAFLGTDEIRRELIGKGVAWELMFCKMIGDTERVEEIVALELATSKKYKLDIYPESWTSQTTVSDPGNQEHCAWQVYAMSVVFPELTERGSALN